MQASVHVRAGRFCSSERNGPPARPGHSGAGRNPDTPLVTKANVTAKLIALGSGFRRNDERDATFSWYVLSLTQRIRRDCPELLTHWLATPGMRHTSPDSEALPHRPSNGPDSSEYRQTIERHQPGPHQAAAAMPLIGIQGART